MTNPPRTIDAPGGVAHHSPNWPATFLIGMLSTTAAILLSALVIVSSAARTASAGPMTTSGGDYVMTVGSLMNRDEEFVFLTHTSSEKMIVYRFDAGRRQVEVVQGLDLAALRDENSAPAAPKGNRPSPYRQP